MKHGKRIFLIFAVLASALIVAGCGGGSDDGGTTTTEVSSAQEGQQASSATMQSTSMAMGANDLFSGLSGYTSEATGAPALPALKKSNSFGGNDILETAARLTKKFGKASSAQAVASAVKRSRTLGEPGPCLISGTVTPSGTIDFAAGTIDVTLTFDECREPGQNTDGTLRIQGSFQETSQSVTVTANLDIDEYDGETLIASLSMENLVFTESFSGGTNSNSGTASVNASGSITVVDHVDDEQGTITYSGFGQTITASLDANELGTASITTTGGISVSFSENGATYTLSVTYVNLVISATFTETYDEFSVNGSVSYDFTPNEFCFEGTYVISTITPVRESITEGHTVAGEIHINDNVEILFNADGSVTVTVSGTVEDFLSIDELEGVCEFVVLS